LFCQPGIIASNILVQRGFNVTSNPSSVSLCRFGKLIPAPEFFSQLGAIDKVHEILCGVFFGKIRGCHILTQYRNKALQAGCQFIHLEGAFHGAF
jgi:hypothetical protein